MIIVPKHILIVVGAGAIFFLSQTPADAARSFTITQITSPAEFAMGAAQPVAFSITNTSTAGETITRVQFNVSGTYTYFPPQTITLTGWTCTLSNASGGNYRRITCSANTTGDRIQPGSSNNYTFSIINNTSLTTDRNDLLSSVVATFWTGTRTRTTTLNNQGSWTWKALLLTLVPSTFNVGSGCQFNLTMTVTNKTSTNLTNIASIPKPPTPSYTGGANVATTSNPANLTLNAGATGTMVWAYTLNGPAGGTVRFTACASTGNNCTTVSGTSRTSSSITSSTVTIAPGLSCGLTAAITNNPACLFSGGIATFVMTVMNNTGNLVNNVVPSALTRVGAAMIGAFTGPAPASIANIPNGGTGTFTWTAVVTGNPNDQYSVSGYATANGPLQTAAVTSTPIQDIDGYTWAAGSAVAGSTNEEIVWTIANYGCSNINQVAIAAPLGWAFANDAYALVNNTAGNQVDTWNWAVAGGTTTFTSPNAIDRIPIPPLLNTGTFSLLFSQTPAAPGNYTFNVTITDDTSPTPVSQILPTVVTVNPFDSSAGGPNAAGTAVWHEDVR